MVGKWHLGTEPEFHPLKQGFDHYYGMPSNASHSPKFFDGEEEVYAKTPLGQLTKLYTDRAISIIKEHGEQPFFLYFAHNYPHTPFKAGKDFVGTSKDGVRGDVIQELDWGVGEMMKALQESGIAENTIVIFSSDNGPIKPQYAAPYRGTKYVSFEGGHRVPFIFHWPAKIKQGVQSKTPIVAMDLFPTLSEIIGAPLPADRTLDGVSLMPLLEGKPLTRPVDQPFYFYNCENLQAVRYGDWKLHLPRTKSSSRSGTKIISSPTSNRLCSTTCNQTSANRQTLPLRTRNSSNKCFAWLNPLAKSWASSCSAAVANVKPVPPFPTLRSSATEKIGKRSTKPCEPPFMQSI